MTVLQSPAPGAAAGAPDAAVRRRLHQTIKKVGDDLPRLSYNTAIAAMMAYVNVLRQGERTPHRAEVLPLVQLVAPFAPHLAEELWERAGAGAPHASVFDAGWPEFDAALAAEDAVAAAMAVPNIAKYVTGPPRKVIFVPGRLLNLVVG